MSISIYLFSRIVRSTTTVFRLFVMFSSFPPPLCYRASPSLHFFFYIRPSFLPLPSPSLARFNFSLVPCGSAPPSLFLFLLLTTGSLFFPSSPFSFLYRSYDLSQFPPFLFCSFSSPMLHSHSYSIFLFSTSPSLLSPLSFSLIYRLGLMDVTAPKQNRKYEPILEEVGECLSLLQPSLFSYFARYIKASTACV